MVTDFVVMTTVSNCLLLPLNYLKARRLLGVQKLLGFQDIVD